MVEKLSCVSVLFYDIYVIMQFNFQGKGMETSLLFPKQKTCWDPYCTSNW